MLTDYIQSMKLLTLALVASTLLTGCTAPMIRALAKDPAAIDAEVVTMYGTIKYRRLMPQGTNTITVDDRGITTRP